ncbi:Glutaredoxin [Handroanthus impetiginosus]|uniref:Glutaredoxin n=1 Tax=Handroanthus impetiginosus TaxID=429701 RepID=A0A2G9HRV7_9LAMI|nr:Glutaredoxin [Handroanthus impetiginosus]
MGSFFSSTKKRENIDMALAKAKQIVSSNPVVVFSKTYCGYCQRVKQLLSQLQATYKVIELDEENDGSEIQTALTEWTGQRTVPNVFISGKHIGGSDDVAALHQQGKLVPMLAEAGAIAKHSTQL